MRKIKRSLKEQNIQSSLKIGFLITYFYPKTGGAENNCYYTARELVKRGHEVHVFCSGEKNIDEIISGIKVHRCKEWFRIKYYLAFYPSLINKLLNCDLDILHVHGFGFLQHDIGVRRLKKIIPKIKLVCTPHGPFMALKKYNILGRMFKNAYLPFLKNGLKEYDKIIQVNPNQYKWLVRDYRIPKKKIYFVPNGIGKEAFVKVSNAKKNKIINKFELKGKLVISYVGRIQKYKGLEQVIRVLPELREDVVFVAIGKDVGDKGRLIEIAKNIGVEKKIVFCGEVGEEEKLALLDISEIFVFPSEWEAFGIVMLEAMACGNAIVSSNTEGGKYLIKEGENGYLFKYGNIKELGDMLRKLIKNKIIRKKMQNINKEKAKEYLWEDVALKLEKLYSGLIGDAR